MSLGAPDFGGITRRKQTADWTTPPHPRKSTVFDRVEIGAGPQAPHQLNPALTRGFYQNSFTI